MQIKGELSFPTDKQQICFVAYEADQDLANRFPWQGLAKTGMLQNFIQDLGLKRTQSGRGFFCYALNADEQAVAQWFDDKRIVVEGH